jgi:hypothetical protein
VKAVKGCSGFVPKTWRPSLAPGLAFVAAVPILFVFGCRAARHIRRMHSEEQPIPGMTVPFVAPTHHPPKEVLYAA